jgi:hypothetical protein
MSRKNNTKAHPLYYRFKLANKQRITALKAAFRIIDEYAPPSLSPDQFQKYQEVRKALLNRYRR